MEQSFLSRSDLLYQDDSLVVLNKPPGIPMHASRILADQPETLLTLARRRVGQMVHMVHRLDRPVSGSVIMACNKQTQADLGHQFEHRQVRKCYLAVVRGWTENSGEILHALLPPRDERKTGSVARDASTQYQRIARTETQIPVTPYATSRYSLVALFPKTGRRHQLRRHMKHISHHIIGDTTYGRGEHNRRFRDEFDCHRLLLHAWSITIRHPETNKMLRVHAPLDQAFSDMVSHLGWSQKLQNWHETNELSG
jgi:tRNA pseudouridine65 synthase